MNYSQDKLDMLTPLTAMFNDPEQQVFRIQGPAGCGKTTAIEMIVKHYLSVFELKKMIDPETQKVTSSNIFLTATTNKATAVVNEEVTEKLAPELGLITTSTIYSLLRLKVFNDYDTGRTKITLNKKATLQTFSKDALIIIDEASYIDNTLWRHIEQQLLDKNLNIVFIADYYQANPVNCSISPIFEKDIPSFALTERFRYPVNSAIHLNSLICEKAIDTGNVDLLQFDETCEVVTSNELAPLIQKHYIDNEDSIRVLGYTNKQVIDYNNYISKLRYGDEGFHIGQHVISNNFYVIGSYRDVIYNESVLTITDISPVEQVYLGVKVRDFTFNKRIIARVPSDYHEYFKVLKQFAKDKDWHSYYELKQNVLDIRHSFACTVHKAQGSTYDYAILDFNDLLTVKNITLFYRLLNVALTRPRKKVYICKD